MIKKLRPATRAAVNDLIVETGHVLTVDDFDAIATLNRLAERIEKPADPNEADILNLPSCIGGQILRQPSLGKLKWFQDFAIPWFGKDDQLLEIALGYISANENNERALWELTDEVQAVTAIGEWWKLLDVTPDEFRVALLRIMPEPEGTEGENIFGPIIALLSREYGNDPAYWFYEAPIGLCRAMLDDYSARIQAEYESYQQANKGRGPGAKPVAPPATPKMYAQRNFRKYKNALADRWRKEQAA